MISFKNYLIESKTIKVGLQRDNSYILPDKLEPLKDSDVITVYHAFNRVSDLFEFLDFGLTGKETARRIYSYEADNNPKGLFVSIDLGTVKEFGNYIIEFSSRVSDLEAPIWPGGNYTVQGQPAQYFFGDEQKREQERLRIRNIASKSEYDSIKNSDRPELAQSLYFSSEYQALFTGELNNNSIKAIWVNDTPGKYVNRDTKYTRLTPKQFLKHYSHLKPKSLNKNNFRVLKPREKFNFDIFIDRLRDNSKIKLSKEQIINVFKHMEIRNILKYVWPHHLDDFQKALEEEK